MPRSNKAEKAREATPAPFAGFARDAMGFFHELAVEMNREWYDANKARYQTLWVQPMTQLFEQVREALAPVYAGRPIGAPKLFRLHRDVRFGKDKTPYKTHIAGVLPLHADRKPVEGGCTPLYLEIGVDGDWVGAGTYIFDARQLVRWRQLVAAPRTGPAIAAIVDELREAGYDVSSHEPFKRVPRGSPQDHPRAELLKMRGVIAGFPEIPRGKIHRADFADWLVAHATAVAPLVRWLHTNLR